MILFVTFFTLCVGLLIVVYFRARRIVGPDSKAHVEGFNALNILKSFSKFGKTVSRFFGRFKYLKRGFAKMGPAFSTMFTNIGIMSAGVFVDTYQYAAAAGTYSIDWVKCAMDKLKNIHICFLFYILDVFIYLNYILILSVCVLLDEILRIKKLLGVSLEHLVLQAIDQIMDVDAMIHSYTGIHFFKYPDVILNTCYRCKKQPNKQAIRKAKDKFNADFYVNYPKKAAQITKRFKDVGHDFKKFF